MRTSTAHKRNVAVRILIYPYHAQTLALFHPSGLWVAFEDCRAARDDYERAHPAEVTDLAKLVSGAARH